jgi:cell cycle sensor histidine kinase DivJ
MLAGLGFSTSGKADNGERPGLAQMTKAACIGADLAICFGADGAVRHSASSRNSFDGLAADRLAGPDFMHKVHAEDRSILRRALRLAGGRGDRVDIELRLSLPAMEADAEYSWFEFCLEAIGDIDDNADDNAGAAPVLAVGRDISSRKRKEVKAERALRALERENDARTRAIADFSHEMRSRLNAIIGFSEMMGGKRLMNDGDMRQMAQYAEIINRSSRQMAEYIERQAQGAIGAAPEKDSGDKEHGWPCADNDNRAELRRAA